MREFDEAVAVDRPIRGGGAYEVRVEGNVEKRLLEIKQGNGRTDGIKQGKLKEQPQRKSQAPDPQQQQQQQKLSASPPAPGALFVSTVV